MTNPKRASGVMKSDAVGAGIVWPKDSIGDLLDACARVLEADSENLRRWALESLEKEYRVFRPRRERV